MRYVSAVAAPARCGTRVAHALASAEPLSTAELSVLYAF
jgi:hypothetical protein